MKRMALKNGVALVLALAMAVALCGCADPLGKDDPSSGGTPTPPPPAPPSPPAPPPPPPTPPATPSNLRVEYTIDAVHISWDKVHNTEFYTLYRSDSAAGPYEAGEQVNTYNAGVGEDTVSYSVYDLTKRKPYYYKVSATMWNPSPGEYIEGELSDDIIVTWPDWRYPPWQVNTTLEDPHGAFIEWGEVYDVTGYNVYRAVYDAQNDEYGDAELVGTTTELSFQDTGLSFGYTYQYSVASLSIDGAGPRSEMDAAVQTRPAIPEVTIERFLGSSRIRINWDAASGADSYKVYSSDSADGDYTEVTEETEIIPNEENPIPAKYGYTPYIGNRDIFYYYKVSSVNTVGESELSPCVEVIFRSGPTGVQAAPSLISSRSTDITIKWDAYPDAETYRVYRSAADRNVYTLVETGTLTATTYTDTGLNGATYYHYSVSAVVDGVETGGSSIESVVLTRPDTPTGLKLTSVFTIFTGRTITVNWNKMKSADWNNYVEYQKINEKGNTVTAYKDRMGNDSEDHYRVYRSDAGKNDYKQVWEIMPHAFNLRSLGEYIDGLVISFPLSILHEYDYKVSAYNSSGESYLSDAVRSRM